MILRTGCMLASLVVAVMTGPVGTRASGPSLRPPEEERFDNTEFRSGLLSRDLRNLLEYYKRTRPPAPRGPDAALLHREELMAVYQDDSRPAAERVAALEEAMAVLENVAREYPDPPQAWRWRLQLGKDLLFRRAEPYYNNILYRGWTEAEGDFLAELTTRAEDAFLELLEEINGFLTRVDDMSLAEFRRVERTGLLKIADTVRPQAEYFLQWSRFYRVLARVDNDARQKALLRDIIEYLERNSEYVTAPHDETGVQAQSLLLVGMCRRLIGDYQQAGERLVQARNLVNNLSAERARPVRWVYILAQLELAKLARDAGHFALTRQVTSALEQWRQENMPDNFALALAVALVEGDVRLREARLAREEGRHEEADRLQGEARRPLLSLLRAWPAHQGDVFRTFAALVDPEADPASMDALERNAVMADLLGKVAALRADSDRSAAEAAGEQIRRHLQRVLEVGRYALADESSLGVDMRPFALFNVAVSHYQLGQPAEAVEHFARVVEEYPDFSRSATALDYAVRIAADYYAQDPSTSDPRRLTTLVRALGVLDAVQPDSDQARYWRYYLAEALTRLGRRREAAETFARVPVGSDNYCPARYQEAVQRWAVFRALPEEATADEKRRCLDDAVASASRCLDALATALAEDAETAEAHDLQTYQAGALLLLAEAHLEPELNQPRYALEVLQGFDERYAGQTELLGHAWRLRILAHQALGQLEEASRIVDLYLEREPGAAGPVMDQLLRSLTQEARRLRDAGRPYDAAAAQALDLARKLYDWARAHPQLLGKVSAESFRVRLAGAHLMAGDYERALQLVSQVLPKEQSSRGDEPVNVDALAYQAEALYQLGRYEDAQPVFYRLWSMHPEGSDAWWQSLLRSLQCHTEMDSSPQRIVSEIRRLRYMRPDLGGPGLKTQFDRLEQINAQRAATSAGGRRP
ncbi:MAG: tetratricopeptide repeat protein [Phycisphaerales bacterium]|nr:MAG: tetratricopeptide repeat protein [Phycisphaerales bacterium]